MGIYLPNMEMPQPGEAITIFCSGDAHRFIIGMRESLTKSKAIPVPNHGRLIDADALIDHLEFTMKHCIIEGYTAQRCSEMIVELSIAPTIIPAEEGE